eukprot:553183_1
MNGSNLNPNATVFIPNTAQFQQSEFMQCSSCKQQLIKNDYSKNQLKKSHMRRCKKCVAKAISTKSNKCIKINIIKKPVTPPPLTHTIYARSGMENEWNNILTKSKQYKHLDFRFSCGCSDKKFGNQSTLPKLLKMMVDIVGNSINTFIIGDEECGYPAHYLNSDQWCYIFSKCPNLVKIELESTYNANDNVFDAIVKYCPNIQKLKITGNDKISGELTNKSILKLANNVNCLSKLTKLIVNDQWEIGFEYIQKLNKKRPLIKVIAGESDGYSMASMMIMAQMGKGWNQGLHGNDDEINFLQNQNVPNPSELFDFDFFSDNNNDYDDTKV